MAKRFRWRRIIKDVKTSPAQTLWAGLAFIGGVTALTGLADLVVEVKGFARELLNAYTVIWREPLIWLLSRMNISVPEYAADLLLAFLVMHTISHIANEASLLRPFTSRAFIKYTVHHRIVFGIHVYHHMLIHTGMMSNDIIAMTRFERVSAYAIAIMLNFLGVVSLPYKLIIKPKRPFLAIDPHGAPRQAYGLSAPLQKGDVTVYLRHAKRLGWVEYCRHLIRARIIAAAVVLAAASLIIVSHALFYLEAS